MNQFLLDSRPLQLMTLTTALSVHETCGREGRRHVHHREYNTGLPRQVKWWTIRVSKTTDRLALRTSPLIMMRSLT